MQKFEYGAMSTMYSLEAENKLTAYCAMCSQYDRSAHLVAIYSPEESKKDSWLSFDGRISERLDEIFGGPDSFDKYFEENVPAIREALNSIKQIV